MFRYFLNNIEIFEPFGMDGATMQIKQDSGRYGRDIWLFSEENELKFYRNEFTGNLSHGFDVISAELALKGADALISFRVEVDGVVFYMGRADFDNVETDDENYYSVKFIDEGDRFKFKRDFDTKRKITATPLKVLLKAKPTEQASRWDGSRTFQGEDWYSGAWTNEPNRALTFALNPSINMVKGDLKDSYVPFYNVLASASGSAASDFSIFKIAEARTTLTNTKIRVNIDFDFEVDMNIPNPINSTFRLVVHVADSDSDLVTSNPNFFTSRVVNSALVTFNHGTGVNNYNLVLDQTYDLGDVSTGQKIYAYFIFLYDNASHPEDYKLVVQSSELTLLSTSTAINSVIEAHRWSDLIDEVTDMPVVKPDFASGFLYDTVLTNGYGVRSIYGKDFTTSPKAVYDFDFLNLDYQVNVDNVQIAKFEDFYPANQINVIDSLKAEDYKRSINKRFRITDLIIGFKKYEQDRDEENTLDAVHTFSEWKTPNAFAQGKFDRRTDIIFDVYKIESSRRLGFEDRTKNTSLDTDDDLFGIEIVDIGDENEQSYTGLFSQLASDTALKLLTNFFSWYSTGLVAGDVLTITGSNAGSYTVVGINDIGNIIELSGTPSTNINEIITISYTLTGVLYKSRTNEGHTSITGIANPSNFGNLNYQQKALLNRFSSYLATTTQFYADPITLVDFKSNKNLNVDGVIDNEPFTPSGQIVSPWEASIVCRMDFATAKALLDALTTRNMDGSIGGFIIVDNVSGWVRELSYQFTQDECIANMVLELTAEPVLNKGYLLKEDGKYLLQENTGKLEI